MAKTECIFQQAALKMEVTELFFHISMEVAMPWISWVRTLILGQVESRIASWVDLMVSQRKKEITTFDIGREGHLTARSRFLGLVSEAVLCR